VIGMNDVTQTVASALGSQGTPYLVVEREYNKFTEALQNGFPVVYGDKADLRFWDSIQVDKYKTMVIASPDLGVSRVYAGLPRAQALELSRFLSVRSEEEAEPFRGLGYARIFVAQGAPPGIEMAAAVMAHLGHAADVIADWMDKEQKDYLERTAAVAPNYSTAVAA
jgi:voltage-gated potassium channel Kch